MSISDPQELGIAKTSHMRNKNSANLLAPFYYFCAEFCPPETHYMTSRIQKSQNWRMVQLHHPPKIYLHTCDHKSTLFDSSGVPLYNNKGIRIFSLAVTDIANVALFVSLVDVLTFTVRTPKTSIVFLRIV
jgi:hypothetical protein